MDFACVHTCEHVFHIQHLHQYTYLFVSLIERCNVVLTAVPLETEEQQPVIYKYNWRYNYKYNQRCYVQPDYNVRATET